jgi:3-dehydroquinate synthetase
MIADNCRIKAGVVSADERESGLRAILNFGHTFAHALETLTRYKGLTHGEAVLLGMKAATVTARELRLLSPRSAGEIDGLLDKCGKIKKPRLSPEAVYRKMFSDKKNRDGILTLILPERVGRVKRVVGPDKAAVMAGIRAVVRG